MFEPMTYAWLIPERLAIVDGAVSRGRVRTAA